jgi:hypothetical protein
LPGLQSYEEPKKDSYYKEEKYEQPKKYYQEEEHDEVSGIESTSSIHTACGKKC